jgi:NADH-quinone oxidoreductase subunit K
VFSFFILTVAAAELAIGLAIVTLFFRNRGTVQIDAADVMKG